MPMQACSGCTYSWIQVPYRVLYFGELEEEDKVYCNECIKKGRDKMSNRSYVTVTLSQDEREILVTQFGGRIDHFTFLLNQAMEKKDLDRVKELIAYQDKMKAIQQKLFDAK